MMFSDSILFILLINPIVCTHCLRLHIISRHSMLYHIILYHVVSYHIVSYCIAQCHTIIFIESSTISILPPCAFDLCHNFHVPGWSDRKRLGRLGQLHGISFARIREWTRRAGARGFLGSRRLYRRRKRGGLQATSRHRDQAWSHFDVGHHGIHHSSDLDLLKLRLRSFKIVVGSLSSIFFSAWSSIAALSG